MKPRVFFDTNVVMDVISNRREFYEDSAAAWTLAEQRRVLGLISAISFNNVYYVLRKSLGRKGAEAAVRRLRLVFAPVALDEHILDMAITAGFADFEDAVQYHSAVQGRSTHILSRNPDHFPTSAEVPVLTPTEFLRTIEIA